MAGRAYPAFPVNLHGTFPPRSLPNSWGIQVQQLRRWTWGGSRRPWQICQKPFPANARLFLGSRLPSRLGTNAAMPNDLFTIISSRVAQQVRLRKTEAGAAQQIPTHQVRSPSSQKAAIANKTLQWREGQKQERGPLCSPDIGQSNHLQKSTIM